MKIEAAYKYIKENILQGDWSREEAINVNNITKTLNISRTPVNKALRRLEQEGYITIVPQVGVFVKQPDPQEVYEKMLICATIDALMTSHAALTISEEKLAYLEELLYQMEDETLPYDQYAELNIEFHTVILHASGLKYMLEITKEYWDYLNYVSSPHDLFAGEARKRSHIEHWMIYNSLVERDSAMARSVMEKHMERVAKHVKKKMMALE
ncbi:GntR family transcriptional regulator [Aquibacillus sediminis]|uniref:GntR family transcriptional regulator n=1 Tax=Aquibacillus sediminis TaxID=2574734 RepID=UPI0014867A10|nr:GntR family transcriptional regulator [Aquibacillus sediminis]